ncbi:uncharacterized protein LOC125228808 [Leguminivora glycinivorella]|uniref:uncharacterized protein LOC125228808 n=1 Tax=Leguminivora glycinivorella TaxID=1035111 RepID=UPI00200E4934|nr:uncharacterized protein LOC125228808 [Leguminivora glycinivorella]
MKGYFFVITVFLALIASSFSSPVQHEVGELKPLDSFRPETTKAPRIFRRSTKCDFQACDQLCRRLKFPGGACIGDKCDCDKF